MRELSPPTLVFFRTAPAALVLAPFALHGGELRRVLARWRWVLAYTAVELAAPWLLLFHAQQHITSSMTGLLVASVPLIGAVLYGFAGVADRLDGRRVAGLAMGFAGVAALMGIDVGGSSALAMLETLAAATCYAAGPLVVAKRLGGLPSVAVSAVALAVTALLYSPTLALWPPGAVSAQVVAAVATLAVLCTAVALLVFFALVQEVGPSRYTVVTYINPLVAVLLGVALLGETFTLGIAVGLPLILLGSLLGTAASRREPAHEPAAAPATRPARMP